MGKGKARVKESKTMGGSADLTVFNMIIRELVKQVIFKQRPEEIEDGGVLCISTCEYSRQRKQEMQSPVQDRCMLVIWTPERRGI